MSWTDQAACVDVPTEVFFPVPPRTGGHPDYGPARAICGRCPVRAECLADALHSEPQASGKRYGFVGGMTPGQRSERYHELRTGAA